MIGIRVDSNDIIATGHVMRCLSIAEYMQESPLFICSEQKTKEFVENTGYRAISLNNKYNEKDSEIEALLDIIARENINVLLIDSYYVTCEYLRQLHKKVKIAYIDDLNSFKYDVDMLINYTFKVDKAIYECWNYSDVEFLLGSKYVPLRSQFEREGIAIKDVKNIFLTTGGTDNNHMILGILDRLLSNNSNYLDYDINVVIGRYYKDYNELNQYINDNANIHLYKNVSDMASIMTMCDIAVSAGGVTLTELATLGIPTICFAIADNQLEGISAYEREALMINAGDGRKDREAVVDKIVKNLYYLANNLDIRQNMSNKMKQNFDGCGARRIADMLEKYNYKNNVKTLKKSEGLQMITLTVVKKEDCALIYNWANEPTVRKKSFNSKKITYEEHKKWFDKKLNDENCRMYILEIDGIKIGQIRVDIENEVAMLSYSIGKEYRGKGNGVIMLTLLEEKLIKEKVSIIRGLVKYENIASKKCFEKCGYTKIEKEDYIVYEKIIK